MPLPLPDLDDRRWADLVEEARSLIPFYAPEWTDHNVHDPGITLVELYAWLTEMDIYRLNRISDAQRRRFLALVGSLPGSPQPAQTVVSLRHRAGSRPIRLPAGLVFEGADAAGVPTPFRILDAITVLPTIIEAVQTFDGTRFEDQSLRRSLAKPVPVFGNDPQPGAAVYLGLSAPLPPASLYFVVDAPPASNETRRRITAEAAAIRRACAAPPSLVGCDIAAAPTDDGADHDTLAMSRPVEIDWLEHHSARTEWAYLDASGVWRGLDPAAGEVEDDTRAFTLNGRVVVRVPDDMGTAMMGAVSTPYYYLRCRLVGGAYDAPPRVLACGTNAVRAEQSAPPDVPMERLSFDPPRDVVDVGAGSGLPEQEIELSGAPVIASSVRIYTDERPDGRRRRWERRDDFSASERGDAHYTLDPVAGRIRFGNGERGRVVPAGVTIKASYLVTRAEAGNLASGTALRAADCEGNRQRLAAICRKVRTVNHRVTATTLIDAAGGDVGERVREAEGHAIAQATRTERAVTLDDYRQLALATPGGRLARARALANLYPAFPCFKATGVITVVILPHLPVGRPVPSRGLRQLVAAYLARRRVVGTRVEVVGPTYREIAVRAAVRPLVGADVAAVERDVTAALDAFLDPLAGGPERTGWPFGRDVYRSELLQVIDQVTGVNHVLSLEVTADGGQPTCADVCLGPIELTTAGAHEIDIERGQP